MEEMQRRTKKNKIEDRTGTYLRHHFRDAVGVFETIFHVLCGCVRTLSWSSSVRWMLRAVPFPPAVPGLRLPTASSWKNRYKVREVTKIFFLSLFGLKKGDSATSFFLSRIPRSNKKNKKDMEKIFMSHLFCSHKFHNIENYDNESEQWQRIRVFLPKHTVKGWGSKIQGLGFGIRKRPPGSWSRGQTALGHGSGFATLLIG